MLCLLNGWCFVAPSLACGEARGGSIPRSGAVTDEQRSHRPNWAQPKGRQSFSLQASLLTPCRSTSGYARRSRLAWTEKPLPQNTSHLGDTTLASGEQKHTPVELHLCQQGKIWSEFLTLVVCVWLLIECLEFKVVTESKEILEARSVVKVFYICC